MAAIQVNEKIQVVVRLDKDVVKRVDHIAVDWDSFRGEAMERLLKVAAAFIEKMGVALGGLASMSMEALDRLVELAVRMVAQQQTLKLDEGAL